MFSNKSVIIIGAGVGGITTAIILAKNGFRVSVYEKNASPGGRCGQIIREGHRFDSGATILLMPSIYKKVFDSIGLQFEDCLELRTLSNVYKIFFGNGKELIFSNDHDFMKNQLEKIEPGSYENFKLYVKKGYKFFQISIDKLLGKNFYKFYEFITPANLPLLIDLKMYISHKNYTKKFFKDPYLNQAFTFQNIYVGQSPDDSPALFSMIPSAELHEKGQFPIGGMYGIVEKLMEHAKNLGVRFYFNSRVEKIQIIKNKADSVILHDGSVKNGDIIVVNADLPYAYSKLLPDIKISSRINKMKHSCSAIVFHWGIDTFFPQLEHHNVFLSDDYYYNLFMIFKKKSMSDNPSFYIHSPVKTDPSAAPPGRDSLSVIVPAGHLDNKYPQNWESLKKTARIAILNRLNKIGINDLEKHIKFEICYTPSTWESIYNISKGSVFGSLNHSILQMGYFRPHNRHDHYRNLFFVGGSTHPGNGVPLVLLSAKLTSERILKETVNL